MFHNVNGEGCVLLVLLYFVVPYNPSEYIKVCGWNVGKKMILIRSTLTLPVVFVWHLSLVEHAESRLSVALQKCWSMQMFLSELLHLRRNLRGTPSFRSSSSITENLLLMNVTYQTAEDSAAFRLCGGGGCGERHVSQVSPSCCLRNGIYAGSSVRTSQRCVCVCVCVVVCGDCHSLCTEPSLLCKRSH
ncbi:hypothetical protein CHARACLAT_018841 [Characodon lateralis]|uniref:Secreted protein n=1 Tax=Characodon lateralis TaxID=208331 RepID=A0ABU7DVU7_9TELE|nr:hypothetical protein [Characodon lateralis]